MIVSKKFIRLMKIISLYKDSWLEGCTRVWLNNYIWIVPKACLCILYTFIFIVDFYKCCPIISTVHKVMFGHKNRSSSHRCFVENSKIFWIIFGIVWPFIRCLINIISKESKIHINTMPRYGNCFIHIPTAISLNIRNINRNIPWVGLVRSKRFTICPIKIVSLCPWSL